ncbi:DegT/DnrJ/EryC1/StrS family aminotransferase [Ohtaekwangia koreensis]|uniref:dTDP-4-amino-4,6-dideoxygalactose transaminase n=1 Tax=Ohtaekwangia koreensis TaxID=688867 RepID=A0A1T5IGY2_9BACT|nr:DegT/DnrJ/EryC1/StrS family aminotransferase [Ohtaekwangia koreensis]SKC38451.1 dTDP-4-amino-4,6-dideoxygalactose transaminase [Ohtaekwangia koreensis]
MDTIKMVDLHSQYLRIKPEIDEAIQQVLTSTAFIQGPEVNIFAQSLSRYIGGSLVIPCANGTDALQIAMMALDMKPGDEVILPVHTYVATAEVIALLGLTPVFIDVDKDTFNIAPALLESKITEKTKAIVPVHLYGQCADMEPILHIAAKYNLHVIEDVAQALGADYTFADGTTKKAGTIGTVGTTSFFPSKNLGCFGDGGAIFTNDKALGEKIKMISNHGQKIKYHHDIIGVNSRLDTLQAAVLNVKLNYLDGYAQRRNDAATYYDKALASIPTLTTPRRATNSTHVFHQYTIQVSDGLRDNLKSHLEAHGIPTMIYYPVPLHLQKAYKRAGFEEGSFPVTEELSKTVLSLPIHTEMKEEELEYISGTIKKFFHG